MYIHVYLVMSVKSCLSNIYISYMYYIGKKFLSSGEKLKHFIFSFLLTFRQMAFSK